MHKDGRTYWARTIRPLTHTSNTRRLYNSRRYCTNHTSIYLFIFPFNLTYSRWTSSLPSCLRSQRIFPSLPGSRLTIFCRDASSELLQLVNQWLNFTYSRSHAFRYERKNTKPTWVRIELTTSALAGVQVTYQTTRTTPNDALFTETGLRGREFESRSTN